MKKVLVKGRYEKISKLFAILDYIVENYGKEDEIDLMEKVDIEEITPEKSYAFLIPCKLEKYFSEALQVYEIYEKHGILVIRKIPCFFRPHPLGLAEYLVEEKWRN